ncbi:MAG: hypothetical protein CXR31_09110 [Geobacter sp.]|nr:MAG: hypothetical protein CXR31_09110 [Geobacter sp.]
MQFSLNQDELLPSWRLGEILRGDKLGEIDFRKTEKRVQGDEGGNMGSADGKAELAHHGEVATAVTGRGAVAVVGVLAGRTGGALVANSGERAVSLLLVMSPALLGSMGLPAQSHHAGGNDDRQKKERNELVQEGMRHR